MGSKEIKAIVAAEAIVGAWKSRAQSSNWAAWVAEHPRMAEMLARAEVIANGE